MCFSKRDVFFNWLPTLGRQRSRNRLTSRPYSQWRPVLPGFDCLSEMKTTLLSVDIFPTTNEKQNHREPKGETKLFFFLFVILCFFFLILSLIITQFSSAKSSFFLFCLQMSSRPLFCFALFCFVFISLKKNKKTRQFRSRFRDGKHGKTHLKEYDGSSLTLIKSQLHYRGVRDFVQYFFSLSHHLDVYTFDVTQFIFL